MYVDFVLIESRRLKVIDLEHTLPNLKGKPFSSKIAYLIDRENILSLEQR